MKRLLILLMLSAALMTGCHKAEPSTVATVSPGPGIVNVNQ